MDWKRSKTEPTIANRIDGKQHHMSPKQISQPLPPQQQTTTEPTPTINTVNSREHSISSFFWWETDPMQVNELEGSPGLGFIGWLINWIQSVPACADPHISWVSSGLWNLSVVCSLPSQLLGFSSLFTYCTSWQSTKNSHGWSADTGCKTEDRLLALLLPAGCMKQGDIGVPTSVSHDGRAEWKCFKEDRNLSSSVYLII